MAAGEYVIKDGDNLWNIAAEQLGKGIRYKEILAVNPGLTEKKELSSAPRSNCPPNRSRRTWRQGPVQIFSKIT